MASSSPDHETKTTPQRKKGMGCLAFVGIMLGVGAVLLLIRVGAAVIVGLIAKHAFGATNNTAWFAGAMAYLLPALVASIGECFDSRDKRTRN